MLDGDIVGIGIVVLIAVIIGIAEILFLGIVLTYFGYITPFGIRIAIIFLVNAVFSIPRINTHKGE